MSAPEVIPAPVVEAVDTLAPAATEALAPVAEPVVVSLILFLSRTFKSV